MKITITIRIRNHKTKHEQMHRCISDLFAWPVRWAGWWTQRPRWGPSWMPLGEEDRYHHEQLRTRHLNTSAHLATACRQPFRQDRRRCSWGVGNCLPNCRCWWRACPESPGGCPRPACDPWPPSVPRSGTVSSRGASNARVTPGERFEIIDFLFEPAFLFHSPGSVR